MYKILPQSAFYIFVTSVLLSGCSLLANGQQITVDQLLAQIIKVAKKRQYDSAIIYCNQVISIDSQNLDAFQFRGAVNYEKADYDQAIKDFSRAIELNSDLPGLFLNRGISYKSFGNMNLAIKDFSRAIELKSNNNSICECIYLYNRALAYKEQDNLDLALSDFSNALKFHPDNRYEYFLARALIYKAKGAYEKAVDDYIEAAGELTKTAAYDEDKIMRKLGDSVIVELISALDSTGISKKGEVAVALGVFGPQAKKAVTQLIHNFPESPEDEIKIKIGNKPSPGNNLTNLSRKYGPGEVVHEVIGTYFNNKLLPSSASYFYVVNVPAAVAALYKITGEIPGIRQEHWRQWLSRKNSTHKTIRK